MPDAKKDTIYIDAEDEITTVIDKMQNSTSKIVALVLPKRSSTLQSIVNLKLLKRTAADAKKNLVLISSDTNLVALAGVVGLHVAKTLQTKPAIPAAPAQNNTAITVDTTDMELEDVVPDPTASIGQLAGQLATEETIELDNDNEAAEEVPVVVTDTKMPVNKKLKVPNFNRFRLVFFGAIGLIVLLIIGGIFAFIILPKAKIVIKTDTSSVSTDLKITADTAAKAVNAEQLVVPAIQKDIKKTDSEKVPATGKRDEGTKATGTIALTNCINDGQPHTVPAGTGFSSGQFTFITDTAVTLEPALYAASTCKSGNLGLSKAAPVTAMQGGDQYNLGSRAYTSPASLSTSSGSISAAGSDMKGGTSKIVQIVSQQDIDGAKQKVIDRLTPAVTSELKAEFATAGALIIPDTFAAGEPVIVSTPNANEPGSDVSVSVTTAFNQLGVKQDDLKLLVEGDVKKHIDTSKQTIQDNGLGKAVVRLVNRASASTATFQVQSIAIAGAQLDADGIKKEIVGKKKGATVSAIQNRPGIKEVTIKYSPFWVSSTPKKTSRIQIIFEQTNATK